jgi:hypothetical protein
MTGEAQALFELQLTYPRTARSDGYTELTEPDEVGHSLKWRGPSWHLIRKNAEDFAPDSATLPI